jgi:hypothetical protein
MKNKQTVNFTIACEDLTVKELSDRLDFMANLYGCRNQCGFRAIQDTNSS